MHSITATPKQLIAILPACEAAGLKPFIMSGPGMGKSMMFTAFARAANRPFIDTRLAYRSNVDVIGYPYLQDDAGLKTQRFAIPGEYPTEPGSVWLLDEFTCASRMTQNASLQLLLENRIGDYEVPDGTFIGLAGNRASDKAHVERLSSAVVNRLCLIELVPDLEDWTEWAVTEGNIDTRVLAFLRFRPDLLLSFDAATWDGYQAFPTPRAWAAASRLVSTEPAAGIRPIMLSGVVGTGPAAELEAFIRIYEQLPSIDGILLDPDGSVVPDEPSARYAAAAAVSAVVDQKNISKAFRYLSRLPKEFEVFAVRTCIKRNMKLQHSKEFVVWCTTNKDVLL